MCSKSGDRIREDGSPTALTRAPALLIPARNNYLSCASFYPGEDGTFRALKTRFAACHFIMLDDIGTKVPLDRLAGLELSWLTETSPGNHEGGILFDIPITERATAVRLLNAVIAAGLCDPGATGPLSRWCRLPVAINGKAKYADQHGKAFQCRPVEWRPEKLYSPHEIIDRLQLDLAPAGRPKKQTKSAQSTNAPARNDRAADDILTPKAEENPVVIALKARGLYKTPLGSGSMT